jgi:SIR2-like domain
LPRRLWRAEKGLPTSGTVQHAASGFEPGDKGESAAPDLEKHCRSIASEVLAGRVVLVLGAGVNLCDRPAGREVEWDPRGGGLPSGAELAKHLAEECAYPPDSYWLAKGEQPVPNYDLLRVSQYVEIVKGSAPLYRTLHTVFDGDYEPGVVHRFLAQLERVVRRPLLILTTNYDDALECAFRDAGIAYDLLTYFTDMPHGRPARFMHSAWTPGAEKESEPVAIPRPNKNPHVAELEQRPAIAKIHGAVRRHNTSFDDDNYVITEDDYIEYLMHSDATKLLPLKVSGRLKESHFLFLGYSLKDWNLRVILRRIWGQQRLTYNSWSVRSNADEVEEALWERRNVMTIRHDLAVYVQALRKALLQTFLKTLAAAPPEARRGMVAEACPEGLLETLPDDHREELLTSLPEAHVEALVEALPDSRRQTILGTLPAALRRQLGKQSR